MANPENLKPWKPGQSGNLKGHPKNMPNRSTIAREVLAMEMSPPDKIVKALHELYPALEKKYTVEEILTMIQALKAMADRDTTAYKALMDSAYGRPQLDITTGGDKIQPLNVNVVKDENAEKYKKHLDKLAKLN